MSGSQHSQKDKVKILLNVNGERERTPNLGCKEHDRVLSTFLVKQGNYRALGYFSDRLTCDLTDLKASPDFKEDFISGQQHGEMFAQDSLLG